MSTNIMTAPDDMVPEAFIDLGLAKGQKKTSTGHSRKEQSMASEGQLSTIKQEKVCQDLKESSVNRFIDNHRSSKAKRTKKSKNPKNAATFTSKFKYSRALDNITVNTAIVKRKPMAQKTP